MSEILYSGQIENLEAIMQVLARVLQELRWTLFRDRVPVMGACACSHDGRTKARTWIARCSDDKSLHVWSCPVLHVRFVCSWWTDTEHRQGVIHKSIVTLFCLISDFFFVTSQVKQYSVVLQECGIFLSIST